MRRGKRKTQRETAAHALKRAQERYGLTLTLDDLDRLGERIRSQEAELVVCQSGSRSLHRLVVDGRDVFVVFQRGFGVTSFLTPEMAALHAPEAAA